MNANELFSPSEFLKSEDIEEAGGEMLLTVSKVERMEYDNNQSGKKEVKGKLFFVEVEKKLALNVTNTNAMITMFGSQDIDKAWLGKTVTLYVDHNVKNPTGGITKGIRIRLVDPKQDAVTEYWKKTREIGLTREEGLAHLKEFKQDFAEALKGLG